MAVTAFNSRLCFLLVGFLHVNFIFPTFPIKRKVLKIAKEFLRITKAVVIESIEKRIRINSHWNALLQCSRQSPFEKPNLERDGSIDAYVIGIVDRE